MFHLCMSRIVKQKHVPFQWKKVEYWYCLEKRQISWVSLVVADIVMISKYYIFFYLSFSCEVGIMAMVVCRYMICTGRHPCSLLFLQFHLFRITRLGLQPRRFMLPIVGLCLNYIIWNVIELIELGLFIIIHKKFPKHIYISN